MIRILSWNICNKKTTLIQSTLKEVVNENDIDIVILQEAFGIFINTILDNDFDELIYSKNGTKQWVRVFLKKNTFVHTYFDKTTNNKLLFVRLKKTNGVDEFNLAAVHLHSKVRNTERQQLWKNLPLINKIGEFENAASTDDKTIIVGDFNYNPFEKDLSDPMVLNCKDNKELITMLSNSSIPNSNRKNWYNPMWNFLGDFDYNSGAERVTGTYFRYTENETPMWNLLDGFILRPSIMNKIDYKESSILIKTKSTNFLKPFIIRKDESLIKDDLSDHLPIKFTITLN